MAGKILVFVETRDGKAKHACWEAICEARRLGADVAAVYVGDGIKTLAAEAGHYGASQIFSVEDAKLKLYCAEAYAKAVEEAAKKFGADAIFLSATSMGKDLGPSIAARLETGVASDCVQIKVTGDRFLFRRPVYAGKAYLEVHFKKAPVVASLRPNAFMVDPADTIRSVHVEDLAVSFSDDDFKSAVKEVLSTAKGKVELTEASIVVSGGRGFKTAEEFQLRDELAEVLDAAVGASRAVVDSGLRPHSEQVGQTGKTVAPSLYIAIGISGAIQHLAGMSSSKVIVAINKDADAPIFKKATYGIVGDLHEVVPALKKEFEKALQR